MVKQRVMARSKTKRIETKPQRMDVRLPCDLPVSLFLGRTEQRLRTEDVSERGVFLRTDTPPALRQLVRIAIELPDGSQPLTMHGMAVHVVQSGNAFGRVAGVGLQLYAVGTDERARWSAFLGQLARGEAAKAAPRRPPAPAEPVRRRHPRTAVDLELEVAGLEQLFTLYTRDLSVGGMFIVTEGDLPLGAVLAITVVHPVDGSTFELEGVIRRLSEPPEIKGVGVELTHVDDARRQEFLTFIQSAVPKDAVALVTPGDPKLS